MNMAGNTQKTWLDIVDEMVAGDYVKFEDGDEKVLKIVTNPIAGPIEFKQSEGPSKFNDGLLIDVMVDESTEIKKWTVTSKGLMQQIKALCVKEGIGSELAGRTLRVTASGTGMQKKYFVKLLNKGKEA
jgi:hypothetical protein